MKSYSVLCLITLSACAILAKKTAPLEMCAKEVRERLGKLEIVNGITFIPHMLKNCKVTNKTEYIIKTNANIENSNHVMKKDCFIEIHELLQPGIDDSQVTVTCDNEVINVKNNFSNEVIDPSFKKFQAKKNLSLQICTKEVRKRLQMLQKLNGLNYKLLALNNCQATNTTEYIIITNADIEDSNGTIKMCVVEIREPTKSDKNFSQVILTCLNEVIDVKNKVTNAGNDIQH